MAKRRYSSSCCCA